MEQAIAAPTPTRAAAMGIMTRLISVATIAEYT
jgi:hypothetical protein